MCDCCVYVVLKLGKPCVRLSGVCVCIAGLLVSVASNAGVLCHYVPVVILMNVSSAASKSTDATALTAPGTRCSSCASLGSPGVGLVI